MPDLLEHAGISWKYYLSDTPYFDVMGTIPHIRYGPMWRDVVDTSTFVPDLQSGNMPQVTWLMPPTPESDHPGYGRCATARTGRSGPSTRSCRARSGSTPPSS